MSAEALSSAVLVRHGETTWSRQRRHTGRTDIPLDAEGRRRATALAPLLADVPGDALVLTSPLRRARETAELAGFGDRAEVCDDLLEWDYGEYEGRRTSDIQRDIPGWTVWTHPIVGGESLQQVGARVDRVIARVVDHSGPAVLFAHAHVLRILGARWCGWPPDNGAGLTLEPASISLLAHERATPVIAHWNQTPHPASKNRLTSDVTSNGDRNFRSPTRRGSDHVLVSFLTPIRSYSRWGRVDVGGRGNRYHRRSDR